MPQKTLFAIFFFLATALAPAAEEQQIVIGDFKDDLSHHWHEKSFSGSTSYHIVHQAEKSFVKAVSRAAASGLYCKTEYAPEEYPLLSWSWKVDNTIEHGDAHHKQGDDYAARLYVIFPSLFFWNTKTINYIWANKLPKGEILPNPYTSNAMMIAVESGPAQVGTWQKVRRNIYEDYQRCFGQPPGKVGAIAIMTDTDNTGEKATAYYGPIFRSRAY